MTKKNIERDLRLRIRWATVKLERMLPIGVAKVYAGVQALMIQKLAKRKTVTSSSHKKPQIKNSILALGLALSLFGGLIPSFADFDGDGRLRVIAEELGWNPYQKRWLKKI